MEAAPDPALSQRIARLIFGAILAKTVYVAAKLGLADELVEGPLHVDELARRTQANADALYRVLRALAAEGLFEEVMPRTFAVTDLGRLIGEEAVGSRRHLSLMFAEQTDPVFEHILESVRTGEPAASIAFGVPYFDWLSEHRDAAETFNRAMAGGSALRMPALVALDLWDDVTRVVDVGGGNGAVLTALLERQPHLHGVVFDLPHARREAEATIAAAGLTGRCEFAAGSFFEAVPEGGDVYVLAQILHDWNDEDATRILGACRRAIAPEGRLVVLEQIVPTGDEPHHSKLLDIQMLVLLGGRERTEEEWRELLAGGGFELESITPGPRDDALQARPA